MSATPLLLLDDDDDFRGLLADELQIAGFQSAEAATVAQAEQMALCGPDGFEALVLDVNLPDGDGRDLCARLRAAGLRMPAIMLAGSDKEEDVVRGLDAGANDYVAKPVRIAVLVARLRAQLKLHENSMDAVLPLGPWQFYPARRLLRGAAGKRVLLTMKEVALLCCLQRTGCAVGKRALLSDVWGYSSSALTHTLETHVCRLRQKIEADPRNARLLLTEGGGYRLACAETAG